MPYKHCADSYRNIKGVHYEQWTDDESEFEEQKKALKAEGRRYRVSDGRLFREVLPSDVSAK